MNKISATRAMRFWIASIGMALALVCTGTQAYAGAYYGGHYSHHGYGYHGYGHRGYGHRGYAYHGSRYYGHGYRGHGRYAYRHGYVPGLIHGVLSIPGTVIGSLFGSYDRPYYDGPYRDRSYHRRPNYYDGAGPGDTTVPPAAHSSDTRTPYDSGSRGNGSEATHARGWALLADGRYRDARSIFGQEAQSDPRNGGPKVGYALSAAAMGDLDRGAWAMRRALSMDPDALHYLTIDATLRPRLEEIMDRYRDNAYPTVDKANSAFMLASMHYLLGDIEAAQSAIVLAVVEGERGNATVNLKRLVDQEQSHDGVGQDTGADHLTVANQDEAAMDDY